MPHARPLAFVLAATVALVACSAQDGAPNTAATLPVSAPASDAIPRAQVEQDLTLTLRSTNNEPVESERTPSFEVVLANRSRDRAYPIVTSSDGSESGWREPHVFYTVDRRARGGDWEPAPREQVARCGNYDVDWTKDVVELAPGASIVLPWFEFFPMWDIAGAADVRIVAHYVYGDHARDLLHVPPSLHRMPAYALASNTLELPVDEPLVLELRVNGSLPGPDEPLAPSVSVVAVNRSARSLPFAAADDGASLTIEADYDDHGKVEQARIATGVSVDEARGTIAPGARRNVVGKSKTLDYGGVPKDAHVLRARARLTIWNSGAAGQRVAYSPWVDMK